MASTRWLARTIGAAKTSRSSKFVNDCAPQQRLAGEPALIAPPTRGLYSF